MWFIALIKQHQPFKTNRLLVTFMKFNSRISVIVFTCLSIAGRVNAQFLKPSSLSNISASVSDTLFFPGLGWSEDESARSIFHSTWKHESGKVRMEYSARPVNFKDATGAWQRINPLVHEVNDGWLADRQPFPIFLSTNGELVLAKGETEQFRTGLNPKINGKTLNQEAGRQLKPNYFEWTCTPEISKSVHVLENAAKTNFTLHSQPDFENGVFRISEEIEISPQAVIQPDRERGIAMADGWAGDLVILEGGREIGRLYGAWCSDADGRVIPLAYSWKSLLRNNWEISLTVPGAWLSDPLTAYPVIVDPLVIGPTSNWTGGAMPSCVMPAMYADSILVQVPGGITVTAFYVTGSFYANPLTTAVMADGAMRFSTSCGQTQLLTVQGATGNLPGTAYLDGADLRAQLMCCFTPSCNQTSFYLTMRIGRTIPSGGCTLTHIYYDPTTLWPFRAYVEGHTVEAASTQWTVPPQPICSDACEVNGTARIRYGVRPYTFTHPWMTDPVVSGTAQPCDLSITAQVLNLTRPNCPVWCPEFSTVSVPPPLVIDACGNIAGGMPAAVQNILPAPAVTVPPDAFVCSGEDFEIDLVACPPGSSISWNGADLEGSGSINGMFVNEGGADLPLSFQAIAQAGPCSSQIVSIPVVILRAPTADFNINPDPSIFGQSSSFQSAASAGSGTVTAYNWTVNAEDFLNGNPATYYFNEIGEHEVCHDIVTSDGCVAVLCKNALVIPAEIVVPNIFTPNGDGVNDTLEFTYLEYYPENELIVFNRWGTEVYSRKGYRNDWSGDGLADGTYYFILTVPNKLSQNGYVKITR